MDTAPVDPVFVLGTLQTDGTVSLEHKPNLPPGPVEVYIRSLPVRRDRLSDVPLDDTSESAPFDLPRPGVVDRVQTVRIAARVPDLLGNEVDLPCTEK